jgi:hypothetical protein
MANTLERFGLRPSRQLNGSPFINAQNRYRISSGNSTSIFQGDLVTPLASGTITRAVANTSDVVVGVFNGCFYTDPTTQKPTFSNFYPQSTNASDITTRILWLELITISIAKVAQVYNRRINNGYITITASQRTRARIECTIRPGIQ